MQQCSALPVLVQRDRQGSKGGRVFPTSSMGVNWRSQGHQWDMSAWDIFDSNGRGWEEVVP